MAKKMAAQRDENGRFVKGHKGGPGRPPKKREEKYLEIAMTAVTFEDWKRIIRRAADQALEGDAQARKFLADYLLGPPGQRLEVSGPGGVPLDLVRIYVPDNGRNADNAD